MAEVIKTGEGIGAEFGHAAADGIERFLLHIAGFGKEFICQTDDFFLWSFREKVAFRQRQTAVADFGGGNPAAAERLMSELEPVHAAL